MVNLMPTAPGKVVPALVMLLVGMHSPQAAAQGRADDFDDFYNKVTRAESELFLGHPESLESLWTRAPEVTLFGVSGGRGEHGWEQVKKRLDWTATQYRDGSLTTERIASYVEGNLGYVVQIETVRFKVPGSSAEKRLDIRATWIFRHEPGGWRILHRQADSLIDRKGPAEGKK